jgi:hypothetical protein
VVVGGYELVEVEVDVEGPYVDVDDSGGGLVAVLEDEVPEEYPVDVGGGSVDEVGEVGEEKDVSDVDGPVGLYVLDSVLLELDPVIGLFEDVLSP